MLSSFAKHGYQIRTVQQAAAATGGYWALKRGECKLGCLISIKLTLDFRHEKSMEYLIIFYVEYMLK